MPEKKYIVILMDGASDHPLEELDGKTPLEVAHKPNIDRLAYEGICGWTKNVPENMPPGSDVAILSVMGFNPKVFYTGRAPLEAASMGIELSDTDVAYRCNLVKVEDGIMKDYSAGHISTQEAKEIIDLINTHLASDEVRFFPGVSYRNLMLWRNGSDNVVCTPPHDITGKPIEEYLPKGEGADFLIDLMKRSQRILADHPKANMIWLWGQGRRPKLPKFEEIYGVKGAVISAVDLVRGIGTLLGLKVIDVPGITGYIDTNYEGKAEFAIKFLEKEGNFIFIHIEAPDEAGHKRDIKAKIKAIEDIDEKIVGRILEWIEKNGIDARVLILPDHPTPIDIGTHTSEPVPYVMWKSKMKIKGRDRFCEKDLEYLKEYTLNEGYRLMSVFLGKMASCSECSIKGSCPMAFNQTQ